jgi:hypothetical protein
MIKSRPRKKPLRPTTVPDRPAPECRQAAPHEIPKRMPLDGLPHRLAHDLGGLFERHAHVGLHHCAGAASCAHFSAGVAVAAAGAGVARCLAAVGDLGFCWRPPNSSTRRCSTLICSISSSSEGCCAWTGAASAIRAKIPQTMPNRSTRLLPVPNAACAPMKSLNCGWHKIAARTNLRILRGCGICAGVNRPSIQPLRLPPKWQYRGSAACFAKLKATQCKVALCTSSPATSRPPDTAKPSAFNRRQRWYPALSISVTTSSKRSKRLAD